MKLWQRCLAELREFTIDKNGLSCCHNILEMRGGKKIPVYCDLKNNYQRT